VAGHEFTRIEKTGRQKDFETTAICLAIGFSKNEVPIVIGDSASPGLITSVLDILVELVLEILGGILEGILSPWAAGVPCNRPGFLSSRTFWAIVIIALAGIIWWELR
jgi:hypothetical protein